MRLPCKRRRSSRAATGAGEYEPPDSDLAIADDACTRLHYQVEAKLAQNSKYLVQSQSWFTLLKGMDEANRNAGKCGELVLVEP